MLPLLRTFRAMKLWEKWLLGCFSILLVTSFVMLLRQFYIENTESMPKRGGTYIEGSVGTIRMLNPWLTVENDVNRDITSLVFSGLQRYNPFTGEIEDDMATIHISGGGRIYTLTLRDDLFWHDTSEEEPRPVTTDDVVFTYQIMKQQGFPNPILQKNFRGVEIEKIDDRKVQFRLEKPYYFFRSNLTLGILPQHHLEGIPPDRLPDALGFNLSPIGSGPYRFRSIVETELSTEVTIESFEQYHGSRSYIDRIVFRAFPDYPSLLSDLRNLDGVRHVPRDEEGRAIIPKRYRTFYYSLPQYVALFFNMNKEILREENLRLALQKATNKQTVVDTINEQVIIDTPLLEFAQADWEYRFEPDAAQGALYDSDWHIPEKVRLLHLQINQAKNYTGALIMSQSVVLLDTGASLTITGSYVGGYDKPFFVNGAEVTETQTGSWTVSLETEGGTGSIMPGENWIRLTASGGDIIDTFILTRSTNRTAFKHLREEQKILDMFMQSKNGVEISEEESGTGTLLDGIDISDLRVDEGILRIRENDESHGIRVNDNGEPLRIRLLTSSLPPTYPIVAHEIARQWKKIGVEVIVEVPEKRKEFEDRVIRRDYDVLLFGQPLLDNLDSYPYWHSSQTQALSEEEDADNELRLDANNLSQFTDFKTDALLEQARETSNDLVRKQTLDQLRDVFREEIPALVLYSPTYVFAISEKILGVDLGRPSMHSDRFLSMHRWFIKEGRNFRAGRTWFGFFAWAFGLAQ